MALNDEDRAYIKEASTNIAGEVSERIIERVMKWHIKSCPHGKSILISKWLIIGACIGSSLGSGTLVAVLMKIF